MSIRKMFTAVFIVIVLSCMWNMHQQDRMTRQQMHSMKGQLHSMQRTLTDLKNEQARLPLEVAKVCKQ